MTGAVEEKVRIEFKGVAVQELIMVVGDMNESLLDRAPEELTGVVASPDAASTVDATPAELLTSLLSVVPVEELATGGGGAHTGGRDGSSQVKPSGHARDCASPDEEQSVPFVQIVGCSDPSSQ